MTNYDRQVYIRQKELIPHMIPISPTTLWRWVREKKFPAPIHLGVRTVAWFKPEVDEWLKNRPPGSYGSG